MVISLSKGFIQDRVIILQKPFLFILSPILSSHSLIHEAGGLASLPKLIFHFCPIARLHHMITLSSLR